MPSCTETVKPSRKSRFQIPDSESGHSHLLFFNGRLRIWTSLTTMPTTKLPNYREDTHEFPGLFSVAGAAWTLETAGIEGETAAIGPAGRWVGRGLQPSALAPRQTRSTGSSASRPLDVSDPIAAMIGDLPETVGRRSFGPGQFASLLGMRLESRLVYELDVTGFGQVVESVGILDFRF